MTGGKQVVSMPLGQGMTQMVQAVRDRIEVSDGDGVWHVTAGSFDAALAYARERFGDPTVLARRDRSRWWPRVTLTVTTDSDRAAQAPPLAELARPAVPEQRPAPGRTPGRTPGRAPLSPATEIPAPREAAREAEPGAAREPGAGREPDPSLDTGAEADPEHGSLPPSLEAIFSRQDLG